MGNVVSVATVELMEASGAWFPQAHGDAAAMAQLAATGHSILGYDTVMPVFSVTQEAAALGCEVDWGGVDMMPGVRSHPFAGADRFGLPGGWLDARPIQVVLEALRLLRADVGHDVVIVGKVMGPWSLSYHLLGIEEFLISTKTSPERARRSLETLKEVTVAFGQAQMQAGADVICVADHITGGMVSPISLSRHGLAGARGNRRSLRLPHGAALLRQYDRPCEVLRSGRLRLLPPRVAS